MRKIKRLFGLILFVFVGNVLFINATPVSEEELDEISRNANSANANADETQKILDSGLSLGWVKGRLLVAPRAGLSASEFENVLRPHNAKSRAHLKQVNTHLIELPSGVNEVEVLRALKKDRRLKYVELDMIISPDLMVSDPAYGSSWALPKIQAPLAWDSANGSGVTIAILDSGVDGTHPDLSSKMVAGWNLYDNNSNTTDVRGHGTKVAGVAAMAANNGVGSAGVAWGAKIMPVRISSLDGYANWSTAAQGVYWAADHGARVVNISFGGVSGSATVQSAAQYLRNKGGVVVVSAGNTGAQIPYAATATMITVAATDSNDQRPSWSTYGSDVDISGPGVGIYAPIPGGSYGSVSGTSFSSPIVAATAALMFSANNGLSPATLENILKSTAVDLGTAGYDIYYGAGRVNAGSAAATAKTAVNVDTQAPVVSIKSPLAGPVSGVVPVDLTASDNVGVTRVELFINGAKFASDDMSPFAFAWDTTALPDGSYNLIAYAYDGAGNKGTSSTVTVSLGSDATAPVISSFNLSEGMTVSNKQAVSVSATDNQSVAKISLKIDGREVAVALKSTLSYSWNTRNIAKGAHTVIVQVFDAAGNTSSKTITVYK